MILVYQKQSLIVDHHVPVALFADPLDADQYVQAEGSGLIQLEVEAESVMDAMRLFPFTIRYTTFD